MKAGIFFAEAPEYLITDTQKDFFPQGQRNTFAIEKSEKPRGHSF